MTYRLPVILYATGASMVSICSLLFLLQASKSPVAEVVGVWKGRMLLEDVGYRKKLESEMKTAKPERAAAIKTLLERFDGEIASTAKILVVLTLNKGGSGKMEVTQVGKTEKETCQWSLKGKTLTLSKMSMEKDQSIRPSGDIKGKTVKLDATDYIRKPVEARGQKFFGLKMWISLTKA